MTLFRFKNFKNLKNLKNCSGFTLIEVVFAAAIFAIVALSIYQGFISITHLITASRDKVAAADLVNSEFELVRNLPFSKVGVQSGIPNGVLQASSTVVIDGRQFNITRVVRNVDDPFDGTIGGSPNDLSPADYKMVQIEVTCSNCKNDIDYKAYANIAPKNLESASTNGALFVKVFDANGDPVPQANVNVSNSGLGININETTDNNGVLQIVDAPPSQNSYRIITTKSGFTTDQTYATSISNPNPLKLDATVLLQQLTQISFIIDRVSDISVSTMTNTCAEVPSVPFSISGAKLIGTSPDVYKWSGNFTTDSSGFKNIPNIEWDVFNFGVSGGFYLAGTNPISPLTILPNSSQNVNLVISEDGPSFLLVSVKDAATGLPISGATAHLSGSGFEQSLVTNQGYFKQTDWSGGSGQLNIGDYTRYSSSDGNIDTGSPSGELKLANSLGNYALSGQITSSIFDTGTSSNWSRVDVSPSDQPVETGPNSVRYQIATSPDNTATTTWNFLGPDGTSGSFYTIADNSINPIHNGNRYVRYKLFLSTEDGAYTPNISDFAISFSSSCIPPGQVLFSDLTNQQYDLTVSASGYTSQSVTGLNINSNWQRQDISLSP